LMIRLPRQQDVRLARGEYRWRGNLARSREGRGTERLLSTAASGSTSSWTRTRPMSDNCTICSAPQRSSSGT
jgi:hypothetical protein